MRAAVLHELDAELDVLDADTVPPGPRDVVVRVTCSGICRSDLSVIRGHIPSGLPLILGHEGTGIVEEVGADVRGLAVGDRVIGSFMPSCGTCWSCLHDEPYLCFALPVQAAQRAMLRDGSTATAFCGLGTFADQLTAHEASLVRVETDLPDEQLALIGCGVTTGLSAVFNAARVPPGANVVVVGCGGVGQAVVQGATIAGAAQVIAVDPVPFKRQTALDVGATHAVDPVDADVVDQITALAGGRGADFAFEVVGKAATVNQAIACTRPGGTTVVVGIVTDDVVPVSRETFVMGKTVLGCLYGSARVRRDFQRAIDLVEHGKLDLSANVTQRLRLEQINDGFRALEEGDVIRSVITA